MLKQSIHNKIHFSLSLLIAFTLPFGKLTPIFIALLLANCLFEGGLKEKWKRFVSNKLALGFIGLYILHMIGLIHTNDMDSGLFDLQVKLSLLIFPIVFVSKPISKEHVDKIFYAFTIGLLLACCYLLSRSLSLYLTVNIGQFSYQNFSVLLHTSYFAMYLNLAIIWLLIQLRKPNQNVLIRKYINAFLIAFFAFIIVLLSAKSGIITLGLTLVVALLYLTFKLKKYFLASAYSMILAIGVLLVYNYSPNTVERINELYTSSTSNDQIKESTESTANRIEIWKAAQQVATENILVGVGTGDVKSNLNEAYRKNAVKNALKLNLNAHNEYLQVLLALGIVGVLLIALNLIHPFIQAINDRNYLYLFLILLVSFNFLTESMLETQAGVMFYAFFNSLLCFKPVKSIKNL